MRGSLVKRKLTLNRGLAALAVLAALHAPACRKPLAPSPAVDIEREIVPWPAQVGPATVTLKLFDAGRKAVTGARVNLEGDMAHPGMRPEFAETREIVPGRYQGRLDFTMAGDWVILVHITLPGGKIVERQLDVKGVRAN